MRGDLGGVTLNVVKEDVVEAYEFTAQIDERGRVTLPVEIRKLTFLKTGDKVTLKLAKTFRCVKV